MLFTILLNVISDGKISLYVSDMFCLKFVTEISEININLLPNTCNFTVTFG